MSKAYNYFCIVLLTSLPSWSIGQNEADSLETAPYYLRLMSGEKIKASSIFLSKSVLHPSHIIVDDTTFAFKDVKAFNNEIGDFKKFVSATYGDQFYLKGFSGKRIETFCLTRLYFDQGKLIKLKEKKGIPKTYFKYYQMDGKHMKVVNLNNLSDDLRASKASMAIIKRAKGMKNFRTSLQIIGAGAMIGGVISAIKESGPGLIYVGVVALAFPILTKKSEANLMHSAIAQYDR